MNFRNIINTAVSVILLTASLSVCINAASAPIDGGKTVFTAADFKLDYDSVKGNGVFKAYRIDMNVVTLDGKEVVKMTAQNEAKQGLIDFSYYQYNNSEYLPALNTKDYKFLKIKYKRAAATTADFTFFKATEDALNATGTNANCSFKTDSAEWDTVIVDLSAQSTLKWDEKNVRQFRLYPWGMKNANEFAGQTIYIEYIGFFKTEAEAKSYGAEVKATNPAPTTTTASTSPKTADQFVFVALIPTVALLGGFVSYRRKKSN